MSDNEVHTTASTRVIELPADVNPINAFYASWPGTDYPSNLVILRDYGADEFVEAEKAIRTIRDGEGKTVDNRSAHELARDVLKVMVETIDGKEPGKFGPPRLLIPLAGYVIAYVSGDGLRPVPSAQPES